MSNTTKWGVVAEFESAAAIYRAAEKTTAQGYTRVDAHTPFPVHGLDKALRQGPSPLGWIVVCCGLTGICLAQLMMWWMNGVDYQFWVSGKPPFAVPSMVPVLFECTVLLSGIGAVFAMLGLNQLPRHHHPVFESARFERCSDDKFFISVEAADPKFHPEKTRKFLQELHATHVELVLEEVP